MNCCEDCDTPIARDAKRCDLCARDKATGKVPRLHIPGVGPKPAFLAKQKLPPAPKDAFSALFDHCKKVGALPAKATPAAYRVFFEAGKLVRNTAA